MICSSLNRLPFIVRLLFSRRTLPQNCWALGGQAITRPLIGVQVRTFVLKSDPQVATTFPVLISQPDDLVLRPADAPDNEDGLDSHDEALWTADRPEFVKFARDMHRCWNEQTATTTIDSSAKSGTQTRPRSA